MPFHDREHLEHKLQQLHAKKAVLEQELAELGAEVDAADKASEQLRSKALQLAQSNAAEDVLRGLTNAATQHRQAAAAAPPPRPKPIMESPSERRLTLRLLVKELQSALPPVAAEAQRWQRKRKHAQEQQARAEAKLKLVPERYTETVDDVRAKIVGAMRARQALEQQLGSSAQRGNEDAAVLRQTRRRLRHQHDALASEHRQLLRDTDRWAEQGALLQARCEPLNDRFTKLQAEASALCADGDGLTLVAMENATGALGGTTTDAVEIDAVCKAVIECFSPLSDLTCDDVQRAAADCGVMLDAEDGTLRRTALRQVIERVVASGQCSR